MNADQTHQPADPKGLPVDQTDSGPGDPSSSSPDQAERQKSFTRRALLQWSVPVIVAATLAQTAQAQTAFGDTPHQDFGDTSLRKGSETV